MKLKSLELYDWKQFGNIEINFHPNLTILTGANGSGKTTILNLLAQHFNWSFQELATPAKYDKSNSFRYFTRFFKKPIRQGDLNIGKLEYNNNAVATLSVPDLNNVKLAIDPNQPQYLINIYDIQSLPGFNVPSHRPESNYCRLPNLPTGKRNKREAFDLVSNSTKHQVLGSGGNQSSYYIKETLLKWAVYGYGNKAIEADPEQVGYYEGFQDILRKILPRSLVFREFSIRNEEIVLITDSGDFMLEAVSGGINALINLAWQIYMFSKEETDEFTVLIDEVENHLHATMQRAILPDLLKAFPGIQFIVSTHNPLIVGSVRDSNVYVLKYNDERKVDSMLLDLVNKAKTATEILREVLGVPFTMPIWVEDELRKITDKYSGLEINEENLREMRKELSQIGLENLVPQAISEVITKRDDPN